MSIKTILVALALEDDSQRVADRAIQLAKQHKAQLVAVHVVENPPLHDASLPPLIDLVALVGMLVDQNARQLQSLLETADKPAITHVEAGKPHDIIENLATSHKADLIVIGPGAAKGLRERVFGSTADRVVRCAPCPVLVVRKEAGAPYSHIAVGVDFSDHAQAAALWASRLSPMASRELIHVFDIPLAFELAMLKANTSQTEIDRYRDAKAKTARRQVIKMFGENGRLPKAARVRIIQGDASITLIRASRRRATDLVILGTQGENAIAQHLLGSVARKVLTNARCDVLVVPSAAIQDTSC
ncbi:universal stress protein [Eoetvoesiella caeni]|uniref:Nucleotide-binding universal stress UspA family protein n=1 Tax=Eoetvoesiella caeni TaxID=645616 RepID=A0A366H3Z8_9BURK|nr:universal stress protein [Eoetvoesiella caeni]MCI2810930.1 universal stress protein [Eoetvoesiella caeni]NYT56770.1 universal stress protein [Eoetvoesiella caeni]RBP35569.1 nucleotide-binding universal stress UspA family protein [Eoetvoesiella caeni]